MTYVCIECGAEVEYEYIVANKMKCTKCKEKRSHIWIKKRPENIAVTIRAR
jgi:DNA-directed RNA polymerase subunit RPC12/RpoP